MTLFSIYYPAYNDFVEQDGTHHYLKTPDGDLPEEVLVLIDFKNGKLTLQDALMQILQLKQKDSAKYYFSEKSGDVCVSFGADTKEELYQMLTDYQNANS